MPWYTRLPRGHQRKPYCREEDYDFNFFGELKEALLYDDKKRHLVRVDVLKKNVPANTPWAILFIGLQLYAIYAVYNGDYALALSTAIPTVLIPYAISCDPLYILGLRFWYFLPRQGFRHDHDKRNVRDRKTLAGPREDVYANSYYVIPLYLALWYAGVAVFQAGSATFYVLISVVFVSKPEYWLPRRLSVSSRESRFNVALSYKLWPQIICALLVWAIWTVAIRIVQARVDAGKAEKHQVDALIGFPALYLFFVLVIKVFEIWKGGPGLWRVSQSRPFYPSWPRSTSDEDIQMWEEIMHSEAEQRMQHLLEFRKNRRYLYRERPESTVLYRSKSDDSEPDALYRGNEGDSESEENWYDTEEHLAEGRQPTTPGRSYSHELVHVQSKIIDVEFRCEL